VVGLRATRSVTAVDAAGENLVLWINRALELLWLLTVFLVPLAVVRPDDMVSSTLIAYIEVPKIALLRTLVSLMAMLWLIEWGVRNRFDFWTAFTGLRVRSRPAQLPASLLVWLRQQPAHWLVLAVGLFAGSTILSTVLSTSFDVSMWGEIPGEDGYSAYTVAAYVLLFAVVASHLKTRSQLWRLIGAVAGTGVLVAGYAILQHYGHDFLGVMEPLPGTRVTSTMGNAILVGSVMLMTVSVSLMAAAVSLSGPIRNVGFWWKLALWSLVLAVQVSGLVLTLSRGPLGGTILAVAVFLSMTTVFLGWRAVLRWFSMLLLVAGLTWVITSLPLNTLDQRSNGTSSATNSDSSVGVSAEVDEPTRLSPSVGSQALRRLSSLKSTASGAGGITGRFELWEPSWRLIVHRPWFSFDSLSLNWFRTVIGYGPDMFRYTYLLESPPRPNAGPDEGMLPGEAVHAHNYLIHQAVELGFLGMVTSFGLFLVVFSVGAYQVLRMGGGDARIYRLLLIGLLAIFAGRFLEQMVGLNRVSDMTVYWMLLGLFVALPTVMLDRASVPRQPPVRRMVLASSSGAERYGGRMLGGLLIVAFLIAGIGVLAWFKTVNYPRAAAFAATGAEHLRKGDLEAALDSLDGAIKLAPDVPSHYNRKSAVYSAFGGNSSVPREIGCSFQVGDESYEICLAERAYAANLAGAEKRPFNFRARLEAARSALDLSLLKGDRGLEEQSLQLYREVTALIPASYPLQNQLAAANILVGRPAAALQPLEKSLAITKETVFSADAFLLLGAAYQELGEPLKAIEQFNELITRRPEDSEAHNLRGYTYGILGQLQRAIEDFDQAILNNPVNVEAYTNRGLAYRELGRPQRAIEDLDVAIQVDPTHQVAYNNRGLAYADLGRYREAIADYDEAIRLEPTNALAYVNRGLAYGNLGQADRAIEDSEEAINLEPGLPNAYASRAMALTRAGRDAEAERDVERAVQLGFDWEVLRRIINQLKEGR